MRTPGTRCLQVRLKRFLEMRGADGGPWRFICGLPALWVGLIYDAQVGGWVRLTGWLGCGAGCGRRGLGL